MFLCVFLSRDTQLWSDDKKSNLITILDINRVFIPCLWKPHTHMAWKFINMPPKSVLMRFSLNNLVHFTNLTYVLYSIRLIANEFEEWYGSTVY